MSTYVSRLDNTFIRIAIEMPTTFMKDALVFLSYVIYSELYSLHKSRKMNVAKLRVC